MENNALIMLLSMSFIVIGSNILKEILSYPIMFCLFLMIIILALVIMILHKSEFRVTYLKQTCLDSYFKKEKSKIVVKFKLIFTFNNIISNKLIYIMFCYFF